MILLRNIALGFSVLLFAAQAGGASPDGVIVEVSALIQSQRATGADYARLGDAHLSKGDARRAKEAFEQAVRLGESARGYTGIGRVYAQMPRRGVQALFYFRRALAHDASFAEAHYHQALLYERMRPLDALGAFEKTVEAEPAHADAHFHIGRILEDQGDRSGAVAAYAQQIAAHDAHGEARYRLGRLRFANGRYKEAAALFGGLIATGGEVGNRAYLEMALMSQVARDFATAERLFEVYIDRLPEREQRVFRDISRVATAAERALLARFTEGAQDAARRRFWNSRDPAPLTPANERLVEHYRRVAYARALYAQGHFPWDDRGEVYVRLGRPDHISRYDDIQIERDPFLYQARERFAQRLSPSLSPPAGHPIFPVSGRWEYWVYVDIDGGVEFAFENLFNDGKYSFADVPLSASGSVRIGDLMNVQGEVVLRNIAAKTPSLYAADFADLPIDFYYYPAGFRGEDDRIDLALYLGLPASAVARLPTREDGDLVVLARGVAIYDSLWHEVHRVADELVVRAPSDQQIQEGAFIPGLMSVSLPPGQYAMALQVRDGVSGRSQVYRQSLVLEDYGQDDQLKMSDIALAFVVVPKAEPGPFVRQGLNVVPMSSKAFRRDQSAYVYFEIYNLTRDAFGQSRYRVDYLVRSYRERGAPAKILHGLGRALRLVERDQQVEIAYEQVGTGVDDVAYVELDLREAEVGEQLVQVRVTDVVTEQSVQKEIRFKIVP